ncbi:AlpA family phage regulatory protein [Photobacterium carnosum]|nr:AlpA family phage regulatory protein [Photobacterium carnosum]
MECHNTAIAPNSFQFIFPKTIPLGVRDVTWIESDIKLWITEKVAERTT